MKYPWLKSEHTAPDSKILPQPRVYPVQYPVLLCHGFGAVAELFTTTPLHKVCMHMRKHGVRAFAPSIVPYGKIEVRSAEWLKALGIILKETSAPKVNIIAYSMSGLDIRYMIHKHRLGDVVASLITISSPHKGASLAETTLNTPDIVQKQLVNISDLVGNKIYPRVPSDAEGALKQLTREYISGPFTREVRDAPGVPYFSFSAACGKGTEARINRSLTLFNRLIFDQEGINDGFVSRDSAIYGDHIRTTCLSHVELIKIGLMREHTGEWHTFWEDVMRLMADARL